PRLGLAAAAGGCDLGPRGASGERPVNVGGVPVVARHDFAGGDHLQVLGHGQRLVRLGAVPGGIVGTFGDEPRPGDCQQLVPGQFVVAGLGVATVGVDAGGLVV